MLLKLLYSRLHMLIDVSGLFAYRDQDQLQAGFCPDLTPPIFLSTVSSVSYKKNNKNTKIVMFGKHYLNIKMCRKTPLKDVKILISLSFSHTHAVVPGAATVIIMVCVGFLVVMVILGVFRIRSIHRRGEGARGGGKEGSNQWDDSALTIIVNPMEVIFHQEAYQQYL